MIIKGFLTVQTQKRTNLILICVGFLAKSFSHRYILLINLFNTYCKMDITIHSKKREGGWEPDCDVGKNQDKNLHVCRCLYRLVPRLLPVTKQLLSLFISFKQKETVILTVQTQKRTNLILISVGFLAKSFCQEPQSIGNIYLKLKLQTPLHNLK